MDDSTPGERVTAILATLFGAMAALLAGVALYGLLAYAVGAELAAKRWLWRQPASSRASEPRWLRDR